jgi:hypothetical protein
MHVVAIQGGLVNVSKDFVACRVPHPADRPDLALSNFFLFGYLRTKFAGLAVQSREEVILTIRQIFNEMPKGTFISVYLSEKKV